MKRALVTGGSGGIGAAICKQLAADGHHVFVHAHRNLAQAQSIAEDIRNNAGIADAIQFDVTDAEATRAALEALTETAPIQILVNNAGIHDDAVFAGMHAEQWQRVIDTTLAGFYNVTQPLMLAMLRTRWGRIINISSVTAQLGNRGQVNYAAAKGGLEAATKSLALEVASRGVTVNAVAPGVVTTPMAENFTKETIEQIVPMKRAGTPQEVADLVAFLASENAGYITGQTISINGGMI